MEKTQREYYLNEQLKAIQKELGEGEEGRDEMNELEERIRKTKLSKEAREKAQAEVKKLRSMSPDVGGSHRRAQLSRLDAVAAVGQEVQGQEGHRRSPKTCCTTIITASRRSRNASSNISRCSSAPAR